MSVLKVGSKPKPCSVVEDQESYITVYAKGLAGNAQLTSRMDNMGGILLLF